MTYLVLSLFLFNPFIFGETFKNEYKSSKDVKFIDNLKTDDVYIQDLINELKEDFLSDREDIVELFKQKTNQLKKDKKNEMDELRDLYRSKVKELRKKFPKKIQNQNTPEDNDGIKRTKPLSKDDPNYKGPKSSKNEKNINKNELPSKK